MKNFFFALLLLGCDGSGSHNGEDGSGPRVEISAVRTEASVHYSFSFHNLGEDSTVILYQLEYGKLRKVMTSSVSEAEQLNESQFSWVRSSEPKTLFAYVRNQEGNLILQAGPVGPNQEDRELIKLALEPYKSVAACEVLFQTDYCSVDAYSNPISCQFTRVNYPDFEHTFPAYDYRGKDICPSNLSSVEQFYQEACSSGVTLLLREFSLSATCEIDAIEN